MHHPFIIASVMSSPPCAHLCTTTRVCFHHAHSNRWPHCRACRSTGAFSSSYSRSAHAQYIFTQNIAQCACQCSLCTAFHWEKFSCKRRGRCNNAHIMFKCNKLHKDSDCFYSCILFSDIHHYTARPPCSLTSSITHNSPPSMSPR